MRAGHGHPVRPHCRRSAEVERLLRESAGAGRCWGGGAPFGWCGLPPLPQLLLRPLGRGHGTPIRRAGHASAPPWASWLLRSLQVTAVQACRCNERLSLDAARRQSGRVTALPDDAGHPCAECAASSVRTRRIGCTAPGALSGQLLAAVQPDGRGAFYAAERWWWDGRTCVSQSRVAPAPTSRPCSCPVSRPTRPRRKGIPISPWRPPPASRVYQQLRSAPWAQSHGLNTQCSRSAFSGIAHTEWVRYAISASWPMGTLACDGLCCVMRFSEKTWREC